MPQSRTKPSNSQPEPSNVQEQTASQLCQIGNRPEPTDSRDYGTGDSVAARVETVPLAPAPAPAPAPEPREFMASQLYQRTGRTVSSQLDSQASHRENSSTSRSRSIDRTPSDRTISVTIPPDFSPHSIFIQFGLGPGPQLAPPDAEVRDRATVVTSDRNNGNVHVEVQGGPRVRFASMESVQSADSEIPGLPRAASNLFSPSLDESGLGMEPPSGLRLPPPSEPPSGPSQPGPVHEGAAAAVAARPGPAREGAAAALAARPGPAREGAAAALAARPGPAALAAHWRQPALAARQGAAAMGAMPKPCGTVMAPKLQWRPTDMIPIIEVPPAAEETQQSADYSGDATVVPVFDDLRPECSRCSRCDCDRCTALARNAWKGGAL